MSLIINGINIGGGSGYDSSSLFFSDLFRQASGFIDPSNGSKPFGVDANGWPTSVPDAANPPFMIVALNAFTPVGDYAMTADGVGTMRVYATGTGWQTVNFDGSGTPRIIHCSARGGVGFQWQAQLIATGSGGNHLRNARLRLPNADGTPYNPDAIAIIEPFAILRFMDWMGTNGSPFVNWSDRDRSKDLFCLAEAGVPSYEDCIALANYLRKDVHINIPHGASDDFVVRMAQLWDSTLWAGARVYLEYSNEPWNLMFGQWPYFEDQASNPTDPPYIQCDGNNYALIGIRMGHTMKLFKDSITSGREVIRLVGGQCGNGNGVSKAFTDTIDGRTTPPLSYGYEGTVIAPYFVSNADVEACAATYATDPAAALTTLFAGIPPYTDGLRDQIKFHTDYYIPKGKIVAVYECGQSLLGSPAAFAMLSAAQYDARMGQAYQALIDMMNANGHVSFVDWFNDVGTWGSYGLWGHLQNTYESPQGIKYATIKAAALAANGGVTPPPPSGVGRPKRFLPLRRLRPFR